jgi:hypothetical protein
MLPLDELETAFYRVGRNDAPALLWDAYLEGKISPDIVTAMVGPAWSGAEYPEQTIDRNCWLFLFWTAGYTETDATGRGRPAELPREPVVLWRGCLPEQRRGMSWTSDRGMAEKFAWNGLRGRPAGRLYTCRAHRSLLARIDGPMDLGEAEYVINPARVRVSEVVDPEHRRSSA